MSAFKSWSKFLLHTRDGPPGLKISGRLLFRELYFAQLASLWTYLRRLMENLCRIKFLASSVQQPRLSANVSCRQTCFGYLYTVTLSSPTNLTSLTPFCSTVSQYRAGFPSWSICLPCKIFTCPQSCWYPFSTYHNLTVHLSHGELRQRITRLKMVALSDDPSPARPQDHVTLPLVQATPYLYKVWGRRVSDCPLECQQCVRRIRKKRTMLLLLLLYKKD